MPRNPCFRVWPETHSIPLLQISFLKKASFFLQNDALIAILIVKGREVVFWKACAELCHVVGSAKTRNGKACAKSEGKKGGFWFPTFPCVSGQTLKQGSDLFTIGQTRVSGFGLKCIGILHPDLAGKCRFFTSVSVSVTLVKNGHWVFSGSRHPESFRLNP